MESDLAKPAATKSSRTSAAMGRPRPRGRRRIAHENRVLLFALASGLAGVIPAMVLLWTGSFSGSTQWTLSVLIVAAWLAFSFTVRGTVMRPLQTLANMQAALREGDFSMRARVGNPEDALGELMREVNALSEMLREQRLGAMEASALLGTVMAEIDVAVFTFDPQARLRLVNRAGERLLSQNVERLLGKTATELGLADCLEGEMARTVEKSFPGRGGRWGLRRTVFRQGGAQHQLLVISDLSQALREEERQAWQRLVRVLGHEMNNSLAPISSIAQSLETLLKREPRSADWEDDLRRGLKIIAERSDALSKFMRDYSRLARLPKPQLQEVELGPLVRAAASVETRLPVEVVPGPEVRLQADPDQLQQVLINLIRNAADASLETQGKVSVGWHKNGGSLDVCVRDEGLGIANPGNLFVPFFTTKPGGSGIGLALSRQIAEAHGGTVQLANRPEGRGCEARLHLPL
ncbi:MAG TPA: ATP-binding protein [Terriglobales bacterium]|jgi:two-component system, NtrC family, nitrogen regulation sensor histidine kinase NtrY